MSKTLILGEILDSSPLLLQNPKKNQRRKHGTRFNLGVRGCVPVTIPAPLSTPRPTFFSFVLTARLEGSNQVSYEGCGCNLVTSQGKISSAFEALSTIKWTSFLCHDTYCGPNFNQNNMLCHTTYNVTYFPAYFMITSSFPRNRRSPTVP